MAPAPKDGLSEAATPVPHYHGHRERLRERHARGGEAALEDYELLEMLLFQVNRRSDTKGLAKALLARFKTLSGVLNASSERLHEVKGTGEATVRALHLVRDIALRMRRSEAANAQLGDAGDTVLGSWSAVLEYLHAALAHKEREEFRVLFLDRKNKLIRDETMGAGTVDQTPVYPREVMRRALELSATALILVHNHPSGDPTPSQADIAMTRTLIELGRGMEIAVHDHIIIARERHLSMKGERII